LGDFCEWNCRYINALAIVKSTDTPQEKPCGCSPAQQQEHSRASAVQPIGKETQTIAQFCSRPGTVKRRIERGLNA
jgi:hypothetical protein